MIMIKYFALKTVWDEGCGHAAVCLNPAVNMNDRGIGQDEPISICEFKHASAGDFDHSAELWRMLPLVSHSL